MSRVGAEFAIPFKSLRYDAKGRIQDWGINFERNIARTDETVYWAPLGRQHNLFRVSEAGTLRGVQAPKQRNLKMTPYVLGLTRRGGSLVESSDNDMDWGLDAKYLITPSLSLDLTYNTDFAQVEVDELQVNLDRFKYFPARETSVFSRKRRPVFCG